MAPSRTPFAGFELLAPGDPLSSDGFAFQSQNPSIADQLAKLGAILHKHDGHAAMPNPTSAATVTLAATGGTIPSSLPIHVLYTLTDGAGGESLPIAETVVTTGAGYLTPAAAPTLAADYTAGTMLAGTPLYAITVTDGAGGETALGPAGSVTINPGHPNARVLVSGLTAITDAASGSSSSAGWRLWRSVDGGSTWNLMGVGARSVDTFTDTGAAGNCSVSPPRTGTTVGTNKLTVTVPSAGQPTTAAFYSIYASRTSVFISPSLLGTYPVSAFDVPHVYTALALLPGQPPAVSRSYPGANQINPCTDLIVTAGPATGKVLTATSPTTATWQAPGGGGGGSDPVGPALGVQKVVGPAGTAIAASATTTLTIPAPAWAELAFKGRIVVGLIITHPNVSQLAVSLTDAVPDTAILFAAGALSGANIGDPTALTDPDSPVYFGDFFKSTLAASSDTSPSPNSRLSGSSARPAASGLLMPPAGQLPNLSGDPQSALTLSVVESGGHAGTVNTVIVYYISAEFDALLKYFPPPGAADSGGGGTGNGTQTVFDSLPDALGPNPSGITVWNNVTGNVLIAPSAYTAARIASGGQFLTRITFSAAPATGALIAIRTAP